MIINQNTNNNTNNKDASNPNFNSTQYNNGVTNNKQNQNKMKFMLQDFDSEMKFTPFKFRCSTSRQNEYQSKDKARNLENDLQEYVPSNVKTIDKQQLMKVVDRLYNQEVSKREKFIQKCQEMKKIIEEKEMKEATFKPMINQRINSAYSKEIKYETSDSKHVFQSESPSKFKELEKIIETENDENNFDLRYDECNNDKLKNTSKLGRSPENSKGSRIAKIERANSSKFGLLEKNDFYNPSNNVNLENIENVGNVVNIENNENYVENTSSPKIDGLNQMNYANNLNYINISHHNDEPWEKLYENAKAKLAYELKSHNNLDSRAGYNYSFHPLINSKSKSICNNSLKNQIPILERLSFPKMHRKSS